MILPTPEVPGKPWGNQAGNKDCTRLCERDYDKHFIQTKQSAIIVPTNVVRSEFFNLQENLVDTKSFLCFKFLTVWGK